MQRLEGSITKIQNDELVDWIAYVLVDNNEIIGVDINSVRVERSKFHIHKIKSVSVKTSNGWLYWHEQQEA